MGQLIGINGKRCFSLNEARDLLPVVRRITHRANDEVQVLTAQLSVVESAQRRRALEKQLQGAYISWQKKVQKLGCCAKGMWLVDFDNGRGYFCWVYPEPEIAYFHGYHEGFRGRVKIV